MSTMLFSRRGLVLALRQPLARASRAARPLSDAAGPAKLSFSFTAPHSAVCFEEPVESVVLPGANGEYGVTAGHSPLVEQLKPGVVQVVRAPGDAPEKYFVSGGFAFTDAGKTEVSVAEAVKLEDLDAEKIKAEFARAKAAVDAAGDDEGKADATLAMDTAKAMGLALGLAL